VIDVHRRDPAAGGTGEHQQRKGVSAAGDRARDVSARRGKPAPKQKF
jgi:hypothetical protein